MRVFAVHVPVVKGIKFNAIEPGTTATDMSAAFGVGRSVQDESGTLGW